MEKGIIKTQKNTIINKYESENWSNSETITDKQVEEAETAELLVEIERKFNCILNVYV